MDLPDFNTLFRLGKTEALVRNGLLSPSEIDRKGSDLNILFAAAAAMGDECIGQLAKVRGDLYVGTARGEALDRLVTDRYPDLIRKQAAPSFGYANFSFSPAVTGAFTIPDGTTLSTADGIQFITVGDCRVAVGDTAARVPIRSVLAGTTQKASAGKINNITSTIVGAPTAGMTVTNSAATFGGEDQEKDADYALRYRLRYLAARRATIGAIEQAILSVPGVVKATVFENLDTLGRPIGYVQAVVADTFTEQMVDATTVPATYATQQALLTNQINQTLLEWRAAGVGVQVVISAVVLQSIRVALTFSSGADETATTAAVLAGIVQHVNNLAPGEKLMLADLKSIIQRTPGVYYTGNELITPTGDIQPAPGEVLRTSTTFCRVGT